MELSYKFGDPPSYGRVEKLLGSAKKAGVQRFRRGRVKQFLADQ